MMVDETGGHVTSVTILGEGSVFDHAGQFGVQRAASRQRPRTYARQPVDSVQGGRG